VVAGGYFTSWAWGGHVREASAHLASESASSRSSRAKFPSSKLSRSACHSWRSLCSADSAASSSRSRLPLGRAPPDQATRPAQPPPPTVMSALRSAHVLPCVHSAQTCSVH
jgi:hypothetical protein